MRTYCITNTRSDVSKISLIFIEFTYLPKDVSETQTSFHSTELQFILRSGVMLQEFTKMNIIRCYDRLIDITLTFIIDACFPLFMA